MDTQQRQFDPYEGFEEGPLTTVVYFGTWAVAFTAGILAVIGGFMIHPGAGLVLSAYVMRLGSQMLIPYYQHLTNKEQRDYALRRIEQREQQQQAAALEATQRMMAEAEREIRRG